MAFLAVPVIPGCQKDPVDSAETDAALEEKEREAFAVQCVLEALTDMAFDEEEVPDFSFDGKTFEPTIGEVLDAGAPSERSVFVEDASLPELYFRSLVGDDRFVAETTDGLVIDLSHLQLGKLTFYREGKETTPGMSGWRFPVSRI